MFFIGEARPPSISTPMLPARNYRNRRAHLICFENIISVDSMAHMTPVPLHPFGCGVDSTTMFVCPDSPVQQTACGWCDKLLVSKAFTFRAASAESDDEKAFCTEQCFSQYRRANFKRNKTCDWCRHLRHTVVNCVDFQDGDHQLQFCRRVKHRDRAKRVTHTHTPSTGSHFSLVVVVVFIPKPVAECTGSEGTLMGE